MLIKRSVRNPLSVPIGISVGFHTLLIVGLMYLPWAKAISKPEISPLKIVTVLWEKEKALKKKTLKATKPEKGAPKAVKASQPVQPSPRHSNSVSKMVNPLPIEPRTLTSANISTPLQIQPTTIASNSLPPLPASVKQSSNPKIIKISSMQPSPSVNNTALRPLPVAKHKVSLPQPIADSLAKSLTRVSANISSYSGRSLSTPSSHSGVTARMVTSVLNSIASKTTPVPGVQTVKRGIPISRTHPVQIASIPSSFIDGKPLDIFQTAESEKNGHPAGVTGSSGHDINAIRKGFSFSVRSRIAKSKYYPSLARKRGWEGEPVIEFMLARNGSLLKTTVASSSSYKILDDAALDAIKNAAPYPKIPDLLKVNSIRFKLPISFILDEL
ncbi:MAG: energy transducer TonB [Nitrospina sp.]|nr:energy transducer TonB [Nitrospina sp.]